MPSKNLNLVLRNRNWLVVSLFSVLLSLPLVAGAASPQDQALSSSPIEGITFRFVEANGIRFRIAQAGDSGPMLLMAHGWPESWYNWRHQMLFFAQRGYRVVAPDMRGYGETDKPLGVQDYDILTLADDMVGILDALGEESAIMVGHDWGSIVASHAVLIHPDRFDALIAMSVPVRPRPAVSPMVSWRKRFKDNFYYILYHNEPEGVAEAEYEAAPYALLSSLYLSPDSPTKAPLVTDPKRSAGGWIPRRGAAIGLPEWLEQEDLDYLVRQFKSAGFRGGLNYYRNFQRNWEITEHLQTTKIDKPVFFIAGEQDVVIAGATSAQLQSVMSTVATDLRGIALFPGVGHWVQQEAPELTNQAMLNFLRDLKSEHSTRDVQDN